MAEGAKEKFDVTVIGGGPAGIMAAGRAAESGAKTVLLEKNNSLGRKLLLTGKGRCNLTRAEFNHKKFVRAFGKQGRFLLSGLSIFGPEETIKFFEKRGLKTKVERGERVFPKSDKASDVLKILVDYLRKNRVDIRLGLKVIRLKKKNNEINEVLLEKRTRIKADKYILCTGGKSYPKTGSTGDGFVWAKRLGHTIATLRPSLVPLRVREKWPKQVQGLALKNTKIIVLQGKEKKIEKSGELLFTHFGLSGPIILDIAKEVGLLLKKGTVKILLDLKPALSFRKLDKRIQRDFKKYQNKQSKNSLNDLLPNKLIPVIVGLSEINPYKQVNSIIKEERHRLVRLLKCLEITVTGTLGFEKAIITNGGISLKEVDSRTMRSKIIKNLFFAGEIINLDGPSGGYNLQLCWTTGFIAGKSVMREK